MKNKKKIEQTLKIGLCVLTLVSIVLDMLSEKAAIFGDADIWAWLSGLGALSMVTVWILAAFLRRHQHSEAKNTADNVAPEHQE